MDHFTKLFNYLTTEPDQKAKVINFEPVQGFLRSFPCHTKSKAPSLQQDPL